MQRSRRQLVPAVLIVAAFSLPSATAQEKEKTGYSPSELRGLMREAVAAELDARRAARVTDALELAAKQKDEGVRLIYLLNAAAADPGELKVLRRLADAAAETGFARDKVLNVLEVAPYEAAPDDVAEILSLVEQVRAAGVSQTERPKLEQEDLADAKSRRGATAKLTKWTVRNGTDAETEANLKALATVDYCSACLTRLAREEEAGRLSADYAIGIAQALESSATGLWGIEPDVLDPVIAAYTERLPAQITAYSRKIAAARSEPHFVEAENLLTQASTDAPEKRNGAGPLQERYEFIERQFEEARTVLSRVVDDSESASERAGRIIGAFGDQLKITRQEQLDSYNEWALDLLDGAYRQYMSLNEVSQADARAIFSGRNRTRLSMANVDRDLLEPETARLFGTFLNRLLVEMYAQGTFDTEEELATADKRKLTYY